MPTILTKTFALLNNIKPPSNNNNNTDQGGSCSYTVTNPDIVHDLQPQPNQRSDTEIQLNPYTSKPDISIWKAAELGDLAALQYYVHHTTSVDPIILLNTRDPDSDCTLLHLVVSNNQDKDVFPIIQLLLEHGADATARNVYNVQAIHMVPLHCSKNPLSSIEILLNHKASPNARDGDGWTPLHYAARFCSPPDPALELLVKRGADVNLTDAGHKTPLFGLLANGDLTTSLEWLIHTAKANVAIRGDFLDPITRKTRPGTIVLQAVKYGRLDCLQFLIRSQIAMDQLKSAIDRDELEHANYLVRDNKERLGQKYDLMVQLLQELEDLLVKDPNALINTSAKQQVHVEPTQQNQIKRRSSFMQILGSIRRHKSNERQTGLFRKMSHMIRRTKSENNASRPSR